MIDQIKDVKKILVFNCIKCIYVLFDTKGGGELIQILKTAWHILKKKKIKFI